MASPQKTAVILIFLLSITSNACLAAEVFSFSQLSLPLQVHMNRTWYQVINSPQEWATFFDNNIANINPNLSDYRTLTDVDFNNYTLIIGGLGGGTGNNLLMNDVINSADSILVRAAENRPGSNCIIAQIITYPTRAILIRKTSKPIGFYLERNYYSCN